MRATLARAVKTGLEVSGHYVRRLREDRFPGVAVLCYHGVRPDGLRPGATTFEGLHVTATELDAHCRLLRAACHPISLERWRQALAGGPPLPARPTLVTFDDGYRSVLTVAQPILARHGIPAAAFVCSDPVREQRLLWYDALARAQGEPAVERWKESPYPEWRDACARLAGAVSEEDPNAPLTPAMVRVLANVGGVEVGGHSAAHAILARSDCHDQRREILDNKVTLEAWTGKPVLAFAYPNGRPGIDYTPATVTLLKELGFDFAFTTGPGFARSDEPAFERSRFLMLAGLRPAELAHRLAYSWRR
jgi:peptidoglycan/xylan/chitin deacetylase (PgdA/CDA1 family)